MNRKASPSKAVQTQHTHTHLAGENILTLRSKLGISPFPWKQWITLTLHVNTRVLLAQCLCLASCLSVGMLAKNMAGLHATLSLTRDRPQG